MYTGPSPKAPTIARLWTWTDCARPCGATLHARAETGCAKWPASGSSRSSRLGAGYFTMWTLCALHSTHAQRLSGFGGQGLLGDSNTRAHCTQTPGVIVQNLTIRIPRQRIQIWKLVISAGPATLVTENVYKNKAAFSTLGQKISRSW